MKIAIAFFGIPRNSSVCFPSILENIYKSVKGSEVRSFYHFYKQNKVVSARSGEDSELVSSNYVFFNDMDGVLEDPGRCLLKWNFENIKSFGDTWKDDYSSIRNLIHQLNSLYEVTELIENSQYNPDVVLFVRPDLLYHDEIPRHCLLGANRDGKSVYIPNWQWWNGLNDRFSICGKDIYRAYGKRVLDMQDFCIKNNRSIHSERLLKYSLLKSKAKIKVLTSTASRVRVSGLIVDEDFSGFRGMGKRENRFTLRIAKFRTWIDKINFKFTG